MRVLELHAHLKVIQRSKGRSATAAAAYRAAERILDERTGEWKDYTRKQGVEHTALLLPDNAPEWAHDRSALWNAAEMKENRSNSQTARELEVSFPHEFTPEERQRAGYTIAQELVQRYGSAVDIAFHAPTHENDERNFHAHMLFTVRRFDPEAKDDWAKRKDRILDDRSKEPGAEQSRGALEVADLRERVAGIMNEISAEAGHEVYVEHLSFEKRGLDRSPTQHMGPHASDMEAKGQQTRIGDKNREIASENAEIRRDEAQLNIIDLAIERERRKEAGQELSREEAAEYQTTAQSRRESFYERIQNERVALLYDQEQRFGERERELQGELATLHRSTDRLGFLGFVRFWHTVTGRRADELRQIEEKQAEYDRITAQKAAEAAQFEAQRQEQLEALKAAEERTALERADPQRAQRHEDEEEETEHYSAREKAEAAIAAAAEARRRELRESRKVDRPAPDRSQDDDLDIGR